MLERDAFLRAIAESPDDDAPRLVFADWLDEHGEPERAEFIRLQCAAEMWPKRHPERRQREERADDLLDLHRADWNIGLPRGQHLYHRGFLDEITLENAHWAEALPRLVQIVPPVCIRVEELQPATARRVARMPEFAAVRRLGVTGYTSSTSDALDILFRSPHLQPLTELDLHLCTRHSPQVTSRLADWPGLANVRRLSLNSSFGSPELFASPFLTGVRSLCVWDFLDGQRPDTLPSDWPGLNQLEDLYLADTTQEALHSLTHSSRVGRLRRLRLSALSLTAGGCLAALRASGMPALRDVTLERTFGLFEPLPWTTGSGSADPGPFDRVTLDQVDLGDPGVEALVALPRLAGVSVLCLPRCGVTPDGAGLLANAGGLASLRHLNLSCNRLDLSATRLEADALRAIQRSEWARSLMDLDLSENALTLAACRALARTPFERLQSIDLTGTQADLDALGESEWLPRLERLRIAGGSRDAAMRRLVGRLGPNLHTLDIRAGSFALAELRALLAEPRPGLRRLDLGWTRVGTAGVRELAAWPGLAGLLSLGLNDCGVGTAGLRTLAASPYLSRSCNLTVSGAGVPRSVLDALRERVGQLEVW